MIISIGVYFYLKGELKIPKKALLARCRNIKCQNHRKSKRVREPERELRKCPSCQHDFYTFERDIVVGLEADSLARFCEEYFGDDEFLLMDETGTVLQFNGGSKIGVDSLCPDMGGTWDLTGIDFAVALKHQIAENPVLEDVPRLFSEHFGIASDAIEMKIGVIGSPTFD